MIKFDRNLIQDTLADMGIKISYDNPAPGIVDNNGKLFPIELYKNLFNIFLDKKELDYDNYEYSLSKSNKSEIKSQLSYSKYSNTMNNTYFVSNKETLQDTKQSKNTQYNLKSSQITESTNNIPEAA